ncbi:MAG: DUF58 domain-containing protein [Chloroflexi bacterium]|nr:DUF58 domain-containing protein [Chloroflexota bacterium]
MGMNAAPLLEPAFLAQLDRLSLVSRRMRAGQIQGERRSPKQGGSVEFADFRSYTPGDDFRQIDWNAYARLERLFLKLFVAEEDITVHFLLDASQSMAWGEPQKWRYAQRLAAALGYVALAGMDRVTGAVLHSAHGPLAFFRPRRGKRQALAWFHWLANAPLGGPLEPQAALRAYLTQANHPGPLVLVSDLLGPGWPEGIRALAGRRYEVTVLHLLSPQEAHPDLQGDLRLVDSETGAAVEVTADYDLLQRYGARLAAWRGEWQSACQAVGARYAFIETGQPLEALVLATLRRYDVVR